MRLEDAGQAVGWEFDAAEVAGEAEVEEGGLCGGEGAGSEAGGGGSEEGSECGCHFRVVVKY